MIINYQEVDKRIEKILEILSKYNFSYEIYSPKKFIIIDNNVSFAEKRNVGSITVAAHGEIILKLYGHRRRSTLKSIMHNTEIVFKQNALLGEISIKTRQLIRKYIDSNKKL